MATRLDARIRELLRFFNVVQTGTTEATAALNTLREAFNAVLSGNQVALTAEQYKTLFTTIIEGSTIAGINIDELGERARRAWVAFSRMQFPVGDPRRRSQAFSRAVEREVSDLPEQVRRSAELRTFVGDYYQRFQQFSPVRKFYEELKEGRFSGKEAIASFFSIDRSLGVSPFLQTLKEAPQDLELLRQELNRMTQHFALSAEQIDRAKVAMASFNRVIDASKSYLGGFRQTQQPLDQYLTSVRRLVSNKNLSFESFLESTIGSTDTQKVLEDLTSRLKEYGMTLSDVKNIHREASTGITRMTFAREIPLLDPATGNSINAINTLNLALSRSGRILTDTQKRFRDFASAVARDMGEFLKWTIAAAAIYAPINQINKLVDEMIQNQARLAEIQVITGRSSEEVYKSFSKIANIAAVTGESVVSAAESYKMAYIAAGNIRDENLRAATATQLLSDTLTLSRLSSLSAEESLDILSATLKQLGMGLNEGSVLLDKWVAVSKQANVDLQTLATSFAIISSAGENVGLTVDQMNGIIAATSEVSDLSAREVGNMIRAFISGYQTESAVKELDKFGVATRKSTGELRGFMEVFKEIKMLSEAGLISESQMARIAEILGGGARRGAQLSAFISNMGRIEQIAEVSAKAAEGTAMKALQTRMETVDASAKRLAVSFSKLAQSIGNEGGILDFLVFLNSILIKVTDSMTLLTKALGNALPLFTLAAGSLALLNANKDLNFGLQKKLGTMGYGVGSLVGRALFSAGRLSVGEELISISPVTKQPYTKALQERLAKGFNEFGMPPTISGVEAAGDLIGGRFASFLQRNSRWVLPSAFLFISTVGNLIKGDFVKAGGGLAGAFLGSLAGKKLEGVFGASAGPIGMMLGFAVVQGLINAARDNPDLAGAFAEMHIKALREAMGETEPPAETALEQLKKEREALEEQLKASAYKNPSYIGGTSIPQFRAWIPQGLAGQLFNLNTNLSYGVLSTLGLNKGATREQMALSLALGYADKELVDKYAELNKKIIYYQESINNGTILNMSNLVKSLVDQNSAMMSEYIRQKKEELFSNIGEGVTPSELKSKMEALSGLETKTAQYYSQVGELFGMLIGKKDDVEETYKALADVLFAVSPQESTTLTTYLADIQALSDTYGAASKEADEYRKTLASLLALLYKNQQVQSFKMPTVVSGTYTQKEADEIAKLAKKFTYDFYKAVVPDESLVPAFLQGLTPIAVQISEEAGKQGSAEFWKQYTEIAPGMFDKARKQLEELGLIGAKELKIEPYMDYTKSQFMNQILPVAREFERILGEAFYGGAANTPKETLGVIFKDGTDKIVVNLLALRLAMDKTNELLQKQLDGIYNLPEGAELWVPAQAAELAYQTLKAMQPTTETTYPVPSNVEEVEAQIGDLGEASSTTADAVRNLAPSLEELFTKLRGVASVRIYDEIQDKPLNLRGVAGVRAYDEYQLRNKPEPTVAAVREYDNRQAVEAAASEARTYLENFFKQFTVIPYPGGPYTSKEPTAPRTQDNRVLQSPFIQPGPALNRTAMMTPVSNVQPVSKVDLTVNTTNQIVLDGRIIAMTLKRYLARDLRIASSGRTISSPFMQ